MIFLPSFYKDDNFIEGNERFKFGGEYLEKLNNFSKILNLLLLKTPIFQIFTTVNTLEVLTFSDPIPRDGEVRALRPM